MFTVEFNTENDAYVNHELGGPDGDAIAETLIRVAAQIRSGRPRGRIFDPNGNLVGKFSLHADPIEED